MAKTRKGKGKTKKAKKGYVNRREAYQIAKKAVKGMSERKVHTISGTSTQTNTLTTVCLSGVNQMGASAASDGKLRTGDEILPQVLRFSFKALVNATATKNEYRWWIIRTNFKTKETGGTANIDAPDLTFLDPDLNSDAFYVLQAPYDRNQSSRYQVLYDSGHQVVAETDGNSPYVKEKRIALYPGRDLLKKLRFQDDNSDNALSGHIWFLCHGLDNTNGLTIRYTSQLEFLDF